MIPALFLVPKEGTIWSPGKPSRKWRKNYFRLLWIKLCRRVASFTANLSSYFAEYEYKSPRATSCSINDLEEWHTGFTGGFCHYHVHTWKLIKKLKENFINHLQIEQITGAANPLQCYFCQEFNSHIQILVETVALVCFHKLLNSTIKFQVSRTLKRVYSSSNYLFHLQVIDRRIF